MLKMFVVVYDNCVTDDVLSEVIYAADLETANEIAYKHSMRPGYSEGNFELFLNMFDRESINELHEDLKDERYAELQ